MPSRLAATQRWMHAAMTDADGAPHGAAHVVNGSERLPADQRLELYRRTYRERMAGCLREGYPGLRCALGDALFDDFALDYLAAHPPRGTSVASLGASFPAHLQATRPADPRARWPDFLVDLARLERAFFEVYDGPGTEGLDVPCAGDVPATPHVTVEPAPCLRLLRARYPVGEYLLAVRRGEDPPLPAPRERLVAISRRDWVVTMTVLEPDEHTLLERLVRGDELAAAATAASVPGETASDLLRGWADHRLFVALDVRSPTEAVR